MRALVALPPVRPRGVSIELGGGSGDGSPGGGGVCAARTLDGVPAPLRTGTGDAGSKAPSSPTHSTASSSASSASASSASSAAASSHIRCHARASTWYSKRSCGTAPIVSAPSSISAKRWVTRESARSSFQPQPG